MATGPPAEAAGSSADMGCDRWDDASLVIYHQFLFKFILVSLPESQVETSHRARNLNLHNQSRTVSASVEKNLLKA